MRILEYKYKNVTAKIYLDHVPLKVEIKDALFMRMKLREAIEEAKKKINTMKGA